MGDPKHKLTRAQVRQYHSQGWLGPFTLITKTEMAKVARMSRNAGLGLRRR